MHRKMVTDSWSSHVAHAKIYVLIRKLKLTTTDSQIFAFLTYFEKLSRRSQSFAKEIFTGICRPSFCDSTARSSIYLKVSHMVQIIFTKYFLVNEIHVFEI